MNLTQTYDNDLWLQLSQRDSDCLYLSTFIYVDHVYLSYLSTYLYLPAFYVAKIMLFVNFSFN